MRTLDAARETCEAFLPGLLTDLAAVPLQELEMPGGPALESFRAKGGPALVIPKVYGGLGADPVQAVEVTRAVGAAAPSLSVATTMHHFSVATLFTLADSVKNSGMEWALLEGIAEGALLVASGFAEGRPGTGILTPTMTATKAPGGYLVSGSKKPCSLSASMSLLTASVALPKDDGGSEMAVLLVPKEIDGLTVHPFWSTWALAGAESDEVRLTDVFVNEQLLMRTEIGDQGELDELQTVGFIWFELLISAAYVGMASRLVQRVLDARRGAPSERAAMAARLETAALLLDGIARMLMADEEHNDILGKVLVARYGVQDALRDTVHQAVELSGGMAFISSPEIAYLAAATNCLSFHPPSRSSVTDALLDYFDGRALVLT